MKIYYNFVAMVLEGILNIGCIGGLLAKAYKVGPDSYITILQDKKGRLRILVVDDGVAIKQYDYAKPSSKVRKSKFAGVLSSGVKH